VRAALRLVAMTALHMRDGIPTLQTSVRNLNSLEGFYSPITLITRRLFRWPSNSA
jgi:hypothetical protein